MDDGLGHRGEDRLDVTVVLGSKLDVDELIKLGPAGLLVGLHDRHDGPAR